MSKPSTYLFCVTELMKTLHGVVNYLVLLYFPHVTHKYNTIYEYLKAEAMN